MVTQTTALADSPAVAATSDAARAVRPAALDRTARVARNVVIVLLSQVGVWIAGSGVGILLPRYVSGADIGRLTFATSFTGFFQIFVLFGSERFITREVARSPERAGTLTFNAVLMRLPLFLVAAVATFAFMNVPLFDYSQRTKDVVYVFTISILVTAVGNTVIAAMQGMERMTLISFMGIVERVLGSALGLGAIVLAGQNMRAYALILLGANIFSVAVLTAYFVHLVGVRWRFEPDTCKRLVRGGTPFLIWGIALVIYGTVDVTILSVLTDDDVVGWYGTAYRFIGFAGFFPFALTTALLPSISAAPLEELRALTRRALDITMFISIPLTMFFIVCATAIIDFLGYSSDYDNSIILIRILALHVPLVGFTMIGGTVLIAENREGLRTKVAVAAAIIAPVLNLATIPYFQSRFDNGAIAAAINSVIIEVFVAIAIVIVVEGGVFSRQNLMTALRCVVAALPMGAAMYLAAPGGLLAMMAVGGIVYLVAALLVKAVSVDELRELASTAIRKRTERETEPNAV